MIRSIALALIALPLAAQMPIGSPSFTPATRSQVIDGVVKALLDSYVSEDIARQMEAAVRSRQRAGGYDTAATPQKFVDLLTADLRGVSKDKILAVIYSPTPLPAQGETPPPAALEAAALRRKKMNFGVAAGNRLEGNVGYLRIDEFFEPGEAGPTVAAAMSLVANTDALIVDVSRNTGGDTRGVAFLCSFLVGEQSVHLNDLLFERGRRVEPSFTQAELPAPRYNGKSVYIVTGASTISAGEEFAYDLQALGRATIIGEVTAGAANPATLIRVGDTFGVVVPVAQARNPITGMNWEGTGVTPDILASANRAFAVAYTAALTDLLQRMPGMPAYQKEEVLRVLDGLQK